MNLGLGVVIFVMTLVLFWIELVTAFHSIAGEKICTELVSGCGS